MSDIILSAAIGGLAAWVVSLPAIFVQIFRRGQVKNLPLIVDVKSVFSRHLSQFASFALGALFQIVLGMIFGAIYSVAMDNGWLNFFGQSYSLVTLLVYTLIVWLIVCILFFPLLGFGWLGKREGRLVWLEVLASLLLIAILFELALPLFQPVYF